MTAPIAPYLYTEARLNIEPTFAGATLHIPTTQAVSLFSPRKRTRVGLEDDKDQDEEAYSRKHLATEGSVFFRRKERSPRSFLWRVLDDRKLLEIQCVDLVQARRQQEESYLTYAISFERPIRANGVAFADPETHDALEVFVITTGNELFTFSFRKDLLFKATVPGQTDFDPTSCFKCYTPTSWSFRYPYKIVATSSLELLVSLHDGGLMRLERKAGDSGSQWQETFFSEGGWGTSLRGLISWKGHNTVRFNNTDIEHNAAAAMAASPDGSHIFTVTFDHTLKAWNKRTGKVGIQTDMLGEASTNFQHASQYLIDPGHDTLMQIVDLEGQPDGDAYYVITSSPKDHQFKFWAVRDADNVTHGVRDLRSDVKLIPPIDELMDVNIWQLADFHVQPGYRWQDTQVWIRARSATLCRTFCLTFDLLASPEELEDAWKSNWVAIDEGSLSVEQLIGSPEFPKENTTDVIGPVTATEQWLDFLFYPGRFTNSMLETALYTYKKGLGLLTASARLDSEKLLKERLCSAITAKMTLERGSNGQLDYEKYASDISAQWHVFFGLVKHLHSRRSDSLSLAFDREIKLPWSVRADQICPVRLCSELEVFQLNQRLFAMDDSSLINASLPLARAMREDAIDVARLLSSARSFRAGLSAAFNEGFGQASSSACLKVDVLKTRTQFTLEDDDEDIPDDSGVQELYHRSEIAQEVTDEDFNKLTQSMQDLGGLGDLDNELFLSAIDRLGVEQRGVGGEQVLTRYGDKTTIRVAQEILQQGHAILLDLLNLVVFMAGDLEPEELSPEFKVSELYRTIMAKLKEYEVSLWLVSNTRQEPASQRRQSRESMGDASQLKDSAPLPTLTVFESIFIGDWRSIENVNTSMSALLTSWSRAWTFGPNFENGGVGVADHIMSNLLRHENYDLAADFLRFLTENDWTSYLKGRLHLALGEYAFAAEYFKQASRFLSAKHFKTEAVDTAALLSLTERDKFASGASKYYLHVSRLFETAKLHSYAADFAALALQHHVADNEGFNDRSIADLDRRKQSMIGSPAHMQVDLALEEMRLLRLQGDKEEILGRLFHASLQIARHEQAFDALVQFGNPVLRKANLQKLLQSLLSTNRTSTLLSLPFPSHLLPEVDATLLSLARKHLAFTPLSSSETPTPQYHQILYAWRIQHLNFRGAAEILYERLQKLQHASGGKVFEPDDETLLENYLMLINCLACCGEDEGWILAEPVEGAAVEEKSGGLFGRGSKAKDGRNAAEDAKKGKRRIVTLEDVRREYQAELDRRSEMLQGRFAFGAGGDAMDVL